MFEGTNMLRLINVWLLGWMKLELIVKRDFSSRYGSDGLVVRLLESGWTGEKIMIQEDIHCLEVFYVDRDEKINYNLSSAPSMRVVR
jgi:hypothetical protein